MSSTHCFLRTENRSICHKVVRLFSQRKRYISIACTGNFIMYALGPFSRKRSHLITSSSNMSERSRVSKDKSCGANKVHITMPSYPNI